MTHVTRALRACDRFGAEVVTHPGLTFAQRQELVIGYMDNKGQMFCPTCSDTGHPMLAHMLASPADKCDSCRRQLVDVTA